MGRSSILRPARRPRSCQGEVKDTGPAYTQLQTLEVSESMECPNCGLVCPPESQRCDCGYDFLANSVGDTYLPAATQPLDPEALSRVYSLLALDVAASVVTVVAAVVFPDTFGSLNRAVGFIVHLGAGTLNAFFLRRLLIAAGRPWIATTIWYAVTLCFCAPAEWALLISTIRDLKGGKPGSTRSRSVTDF